MKRVFLIVLDSFGCGEAPDAAAFGDEGADTLRSVAASAEFHAPNLEGMGLGLIPGVTGVKETARPAGAYGRMQEQSAGKDTIDCLQPDRLSVHVPVIVNAVFLQ